MSGLWRRLRAALPRFRKGVAAGWGTLTPSVVVGVLLLLGVHIDLDTAAWIIAVGSPLLGTGAVVASKPNAS